jgi:hypothetical protein
MNGGAEGAKPVAVASMGMRRDFPPSGNGDDAPRLVVFEVINLKPVKGEVPWSRLHELSFEVKPFAWGSIWPSA